MTKNKAIAQALSVISDTPAGLFQLSQSHALCRDCSMEHPAITGMALGLVYCCFYGFCVVMVLPSPRSRPCPLPSTVFVLMYILYVMVVFVGRVLYQKVIKKKLLGRGDIPREGYHTHMHSHTHAHTHARTHTKHTHTHLLGGGARYEASTEEVGSCVVAYTSHQVQCIITS